MILEMNEVYHLVETSLKEGKKTHKWESSKIKTYCLLYGFSG